jgi:hypothetical protein
MLLNEFLKEHREVEEQERRILEQEATVARLKTDLEANAAEQQKEIKALVCFAASGSHYSEPLKPGLVSSFSDRIILVPTPSSRYALGLVPKRRSKAR